MASRVRRHTLCVASRWICASTRWLTPPTGWSALFYPTISLLEEVPDDHGSRAGPRAGATPRAALLGGGRAVDRDHGPGSGHGPERYASGEPRGAGSPARIRLRLRGHP